MTCDECQEQVFELIERERTEPEAVREVLARCPECRALFTEMKAALAEASQLPAEEPPPEIDQLILEAARQRLTERASGPRPWYRSPQWAVAATALLAVGIGVWAIPRSGPVEMEGAPAESAADVAAGRGPLAPKRAAQTHADEQVPEAATDVLLAQEPAAASPPAAEKAEAREAKRTIAPRVAHRAASAPIAREEDASGARASSSAVSLEPATADAADEESVLKEQLGTSPECEARLKKLESTAIKRVETETSPEDALAIGRCYGARGNITEARRWLERAASDPKTRDQAIRALKALPTR